jgi:hypothetical protein
VCLCGRGALTKRKTLSSLQHKEPGPHTTQDMLPGISANGTSNIRPRKCATEASLTHNNCHNNKETERQLKTTHTWTKSTLEVGQQRLLRVWPGAFGG